VAAETTQGHGGADAWAGNFLAVLEMDPERVREGARRAYADLLGQPPPAYLRSSP
jgi:hypothetical protein